METLESLMSVLRRVKLFITIGSAVASALALAVVRVTERILDSFGDAGSDLVERLFENPLIGLAALAGIGLGVLGAFLKHDGEPKAGELPLYLAVGAFGIAFLFWIGPQIAHVIASEVLSPLFEILADFLAGDATFSIKLLLKILFAVYLVSFLVDLAYGRLIEGRDMRDSVEAMCKKYWKELLEVMHDLYEVALFLPRLAGRRSHDG